MPSQSAIDYGRTVREKAEELLGVLKSTGLIPRPDDKRELALRNDAVKLLRHEDRIRLNYKEGTYFPTDGETVLQMPANMPPPRRSGIQRRTRFDG